MYRFSDLCYQKEITYVLSNQILNNQVDKCIDKNYRLEIDKYHHCDMVDWHMDQYLIRTLFINKLNFLVITYDFHIVVLYMDLDNYM